MKKILLGMVLVLAVNTQAQAESSVWRLRRGESVLYLAGSCHLLRQADFPLPPEFEQAYRDSAVVVFETDIGKFNDPETQRKLLAKAAYGDGSTLDQHLSASTFHLLHEYCTSHGLPLTTLIKLKPAMVALTLTTFELAGMGVAQEGADTFLYKLAVNDHKGHVGLETIDQQIEFVTTLGEGDEDNFIAYALRDIATIRQDYEALLAAWKIGDANKLDELTLREFKREFPMIYRKLITARNENWLPMLEAYLATPEKELVLVGAAHLVGADGIIESLRRKGYTVEKL
jgi:uncharacterized protein YbaP (TraB family)